MTTKEILECLLNGKVLRQQKKTRYGILTRLYTLKDGKLYSKSTFHNSDLLGEHWVREVDLDLRGVFEIIDDYIGEDEMKIK